MGAMTIGPEPTVWAQPRYPSGGYYGGIPSTPPATPAWTQEPQAPYGWGAPAPVAGPQPFAGPVQPGATAGWPPPAPGRRSTATWWLLGATGVLGVIAL